MKLKGLTKLALSGVALAAVAATLGTSTYAWYVSNSKAEVSGISGSSNTQAAGSLLINKLKADSASKVAADSAWTNKLTYANLAYKAATSLEPVTKDKTDYTPSGDNVTATGWHNVSNSVVKNDTTSIPYGYFMFGIETTDDAKRTVNMTLGIQNTTASNVQNSQTAYTTSGIPTNLDDDQTTHGKYGVGDPFTVDFVYALKFDYHFEALTTGSSAKTEDGYYLKNSDTNGTFASYAADSFKNLALSSSYVRHDDYATDGNAHDYYRALSEDNIVDKSESAQTVKRIAGGESDGSVNMGDNIQFTLPDGNPYVLVLRYWLDGADAQCFDSCIAQSFELFIKLETVATV